MSLVFAAIVTFSVAMVYASCVAFADRHGASVSPPWYTQVLLVPVLALAYLGMARWKQIGRALAMANVALWGWVLVATWMLKLFPLYSGGGSAPMRLRDVWTWYAHGAASHARDLSLTALAPAAWLYVGMLVSVGLTIVLGARLVRALSS